MRALALGVRLSVRGALSVAERDDFALIRLEKRTSAAEAVKRTAIYGTAKAVPFVESLFPIWLKAFTNLIGIFGTALQAAEKVGTGRERRPQGLKPDVFSIIYGPTKVVP